MSATPRLVVTVITPSYDQGRFLEQTLRSVLDQDYPLVQYLVVDGGSTDQSVEMIRSYADRIDWWVSEPDRGQAHAVNKGLARATGDIVSWLNSDDLLTPGAIARVVAVFEANPWADVIYSDFDYLNEDTGQRHRIAVQPRTFVSMLRDGNVIPQPTAFLRRAFLERIGRLDESLHIELDSELWLRAALHGSLLYLEGESLAILRDHPAAKTRQAKDRKGLELIGIFDRLYARPGLPEAALRVKSDAYARAYWWIAKGRVDLDRAYPDSVHFLVRSLILSLRPAMAQPLATLRIAFAGLRSAFRRRTDRA